MQQAYNLFASSINMVEPDLLSASAKLEKILGFGRFQKFQVYVFASLVCFLGAMNTFQLVFFVTRRPFRCSLPPNIDNRFNDMSIEDLSSITPGCTMAAFSNGSLCQSAKSKSVSELLGNCFNNSIQVTCEFGYHHSLSGSDAFWSLTAENDWVCEKAEYGPNLLMAQNIGIVFNSLFFMQLSDTWGRRPVFHITNLTFVISRLLILILHDNFTAVMIVTAMGSAFYPVGIRVVYTLVAEYTDDKGRLHLYAATWVLWVLGIAFLSLVAWWTQHWFYYGIATTVANCLLFPFWWVSPESPRLLLTQNKVKRADKIIRRIKRINNEPLPESFSAELNSIANEIATTKKSGMLSLFTFKSLRFLTFIFSITWIVNDFLYIGGQMNAENLAGNQFVNFAIVAFTELPSVFIGEFMINRIGRRWSHCMCMALSTLFFLVIIPISEFKSLGWIVTVLAICAKTASNVGWFINYVQNMEMYPTCARVSGMNFCSTMATIVSTTAPYVTHLGQYDMKLMYGIFASMGCLGIVASSFVPESFKEDFPECIEDLERRPSNPFFSWKVWEKKTKKSNNDGAM